ncbi:hypothetical protein L873DRAFT_1787194 [Choiromyces venosus 120613-1]|uniref:Uncharacterized protein n=1 Tax=Choiromyces venosus 120613-1 TaxID=1336337 RepID=A0A3N4K0L1_9PEZI|nr:hypothetical protein L873DRAFT_1787194 [Choiromyces venosus 120613-1]
MTGLLDEYMVRDKVLQRVIPLIPPQSQTPLLRSQNHPLSSGNPQNHTATLHPSSILKYSTSKNLTPTPSSPSGYTSDTHSAMRTPEINAYYPNSAHCDDNSTPFNLYLTNLALPPPQNKPPTHLVPNTY